LQLVKRFEGLRIVDTMRIILKIKSKLRNKNKNERLGNDFPFFLWMATYTAIA
jgi:hypothetical protein